MDRSLADHRLWQFQPFAVQVEADAFVGAEPFLADGVRVVQTGEGFTISGTYGFDCFADHRFVVLIDGQTRVFHRYEDIPSVIDNVVQFLPDTTHDITVRYHFTRGAAPLLHTHWVHHDTAPWKPRLQELVARETNGGWNARSHPSRGRRHSPLLADEPRRGLAQRLLQWASRLTAG